MNRQLIDRYADGAQQLVQAVSGMSAADLLATPISGRWSTHQVVIHLADAEASFADRMKRIIAMDDPVLLAWEENKFIERLHYDQQSVEDAVVAIGIVRRQMVRVFRALPDDTFTRFGEHSERGRQTLEAVLTFATNHMEHHLKFVAEKRAKITKPV